MSLKYKVEYTLKIFILLLAMPSSKPITEQQTEVTKDKEKLNDPFESLSPELKKTWQYVLDNHPWIIRDDKSETSV
jgi:ABC-type uncharacterized transport system YnjBCD substrate-binding protein